MSYVRTHCLFTLCCSSLPFSGGLSNFLYYVSLPQENANEGVDYQTPVQAVQTVETSIDRATATAILTYVPDDENRNEPHYNDLLTVGDLNGNKRKRYDSTSSASSTATRQNEPQEVDNL